MTERFDAIVIGAGHNGLVCATLLAKSGKRVVVLEANEQVGGAAVTRPFADGYAVSACAHLLYQLQPAVRRELGIDLKLAGEDLATVALDAAGQHVRVVRDDVSGVSGADRTSYRAFRKRMTRFADLLNGHLNAAPPRLGTKDRGDLFKLARLGFDIRRLGRAEMQEFLRLIGMNIHDELNERFESDLLKGALALDAVLGTHLGPRSPNTIMTYLYRLAGNHGRLSVPQGGMGELTGSLAQAARTAGATVRVGKPVRRIIVANGRATGVETEDGECYESLTVVSSADPKRTVLELVGARNVETGFAQRINRARASGNAARLHLALEELPAIKGLEAADYGQRLVIAPDEHYVERAFNPAKYGEYSPEPVAEITFPSVRDPSLAPDGRHVLSATLQHAPYALRSGWDGSARTAFLDRVMTTLERYMPGLAKQVVARELLTPVDIEREFHITGGHWHHVELALDQFMFVRPVSGAAQYAMPLDGLYLCGAGTHPGGGVSGAPGRNAARAILGREKSR